MAMVNEQDNHYNDQDQNEYRYQNKRHQQSWTCGCFAGLPQLPLCSSRGWIRGVVHLRRPGGTRRLRHAGIV